MIANIYIVCNSVIMTQPLFPNPENLINQYKSGLSAASIAKKYNTSTSVITRTLKNAGVKIRSLSEAHADFRGEKHPRFGHKDISGEKNPNWMGGIEVKYDRERYTKQYREWKKEVILRDNFTCALCSSHERRSLVCHHIVSWRKDESKRFDISNGLTLCNSCHCKIGYNEESYISFFTSLVNLRSV